MPLRHLWNQGADLLPGTFPDISSESDGLVAVAEIEKNINSFSICDANAFLHF